MNVTVPVGRSSDGPSLIGIPRVFLPPDDAFSPAGAAPPGGRYLALVRDSGHDDVGLLAIPVLRGREGAEARAKRRFAKVDASGRFALGIHERIADGDERVSVRHLHRPWLSLVREWVARPFGVRYVVLRVSKSLPVDVERPVVRCQAKAFDLLGCDPGDRVLLVSSRLGTGDRAEWATVTGQAFEISQNDFDERIAREVPRISPDKPWISPERALGMDIDVPRAFMPLEMRQALGVDAGGVILMRREIRSLFGRNFREFGLLVLLSGLALSQLPLPIEPSWWASLAFLASSLLLGLVITGTSIRSKVRVGRISRTAEPRWRAWLARPRPEPEEDDDVP